MPKQVSNYRINKAAKRYFNISDKPYREADAKQKEYMANGGEYRSAHWCRLESMKGQAVNSGMDYRALLEDLGLWTEIAPILSDMRISYYKEQNPIADAVS